MEKPKLNRMCETFIKIEQQMSNKLLFDIMRFKIYPLVTDLKKNGIINWYNFLIHNKTSGVPTTLDDNNVYYHIRVSLEDDIKYEDFKSMLPEYCTKTRQCDQKSVEQIGITQNTVFDTSLLKNEGIEDIWLFIGEQSEGLLKMLHAYKKSVDVPIQHLFQFVHYYFNMTGLGVKCPSCKTILPL